MEGDMNTSQTDLFNDNNMEALSKKPEEPVAKPFKSSQVFHETSLPASPIPLRQKKKRHKTSNASLVIYKFPQEYEKDRIRTSKEIRFHLSQNWWQKWSRRLCPTSLQI